MENIKTEIKRFLKSEKKGPYKIKNAKVIKSIKRYGYQGFNNKAVDSFVHYIKGTPVLILNEFSYALLDKKITYLRLLKSVAIFQNGECYLFDDNKHIIKLSIKDNILNDFDSPVKNTGGLNAEEMFPASVFKSDVRCVNDMFDLKSLFPSKANVEDILEFDRLSSLNVYTPNLKKVKKNIKMAGPWFRSTCFLSKVEDYLCFQFFCYDKKNIDIYEVARIYISKTKIICAKINFEKKLVVNKEVFFINADNLYVDESVNKSVYKYIKKDVYYLMKKSIWTRKKNSLTVITQLLCGVPFFEKLVKEGMPEQLIEFINDLGAFNYKEIEKYFGRKLIENPNITPKKFYGINEYQKKYLKSIKINTSIKSIIETGRYLLNGKDISFLSDKQSKILIDYLNTFPYERVGINFAITYSCFKRGYIEIDDLKYAYNNISTSFLFKILEMYNKNYKKKRYYALYEYYPDYFHMAVKLHASGIKNIFELYQINTQNFSATKKIHDSLSVFYEDFLAKESDIKFEGYVSKMNKYLFEDKNFKIVVPKSTYDLKMEGKELHNCLGSYCDRILAGKTNVVFIRKQNNIEKPFFAAEISNTGQLKQVHGFANKNANKEKGLTGFIENWSKKTGLNYYNYNRVM